MLLLGFSLTKNAFYLFIYLYIYTTGMI